MGYWQDVDLVQCRISSIPALQLDRFTNLEVNIASRLEDPALQVVEEAYNASYRDCASVRIRSLTSSSRAPLVRSYKT